MLKAKPSVNLLIIKLRREFYISIATTYSFRRYSGGYHRFISTPGAASQPGLLDGDVLVGWNQNTLEMAQWWANIYRNQLIDSVFPLYLSLK